MSDIFREVEEDLRRDQLVRFWNRYGLHVIVLGVLIVVGIGGWRGYLWYAESQAREASARYEAAVRLAAEGKTEEAETAFAAVAASAPEGYALLARMRAAGEQAKRDPKLGVSSFDAIAGDGGVDPLFRDLARVRAATLLVDSGSFDEVKSRMEPLAAPDGAYRHAARELIGLAAYKAGNTAEARRWIRALTEDPEAPVGARQRAQILLALVGEDETAEPGAGADAAPVR